MVNPVSSVFCCKQRKKEFDEAFGNVPITSYGNMLIATGNNVVLPVDTYDAPSDIE